MTTANAPILIPSETSMLPTIAQRRFRVYLVEAKYELVKLMRIPAFVIPTLGFPLMFYALFGLVLNRGNSFGAPVASYMLATYGAFGVISIALFALGVGVASERGQGWLAVKRASPMPIAAYFFGKYVMTVLFGFVLMLLLCAMGAIFGHVHLSTGQWISLVLIETLGGLPFCAMGLAVGYMAGPNSAAAVVNSFYLPMAFLSGLFIPAEMLPKLLQKVAYFLPPYHLGRLALTAVGVEPASNAWIHVAALLGFGVLFTGLAVVAYRRDEGKTYG